MRLGRSVGVSKNVRKFKIQLPNDISVIKFTIIKYPVSMEETAFKYKMV